MINSYTNIKHHMVSWQSGPMQKPAKLSNRGFKSHRYLDVFCFTKKLFEIFTYLPIFIFTKPS